MTSALEPVRHRTTMHQVGRSTGVPAFLQVLDRLGGTRDVPCAVVCSEAFSGAVLDLLWR